MRARKITFPLTTYVGYSRKWGSKACPTMAAVLALVLMTQLTIALHPHPHLLKETQGHPARRLQAPHLNARASRTARMPTPRWL